MQLFSYYRVNAVILKVSRDPTKDQSPTSNPEQSHPAPEEYDDRLFCKRESGEGSEGSRAPSKGWCSLRTGVDFSKGL